MSSRPNDDLFEGTKMSFGQHLEELRVVLFRSIIGIVIGLIVGLLVARHVVSFIQTPLKAALEDYYLDREVEKLHEKYKEDTPPEMLVMISEEHVIPTMMRIDVRKLREAITEIDPEFPAFTLYRYVPEDIALDDDKNPKYAAFCQKLVDDGQGENGTPGKRVWSLLNDEQKQLLNSLADKQPFGQEDVTGLIGLLDALADNPQLHQAEEFSKLHAPKEKRVRLLDPSSWFAGESKTDEAFRKQIDRLREQFQADSDAGRELDPAQSRRLNRILISAAFPDFVKRPRIRLIDVTAWKPIEIRIQTLNAQEAFMIWLKAGFITALIISSPWIFWQIWMFVAAGLYPHEKRYVYIFLPFSLVLFLAGTGLAFFFVFKPVLNFLFGFNAMMEIDPDPRISEWLSFVLFLPLGFGIAFQLPLVMLFLNRIGLFSIEAYMQKWRIAILVIFVISMILTPADPISMLLMAVPLTLLYFLGVALARWMPKGRSPFSEAYEP